MHAIEQLPNGPLISWYGDDFTGAAAVMEVLTFAGLPSMLFLNTPTQDQLAQFPELRAIGVASTARAQSPEWMDEHFPTVFSQLAQLRTPIVHYKVCTTLDSSPNVGSIGRAMELGAEALGSNYVPILIAAPQMRRYQCFGHLFAAASNDVFRLDLHPVMAKHPVTPMNESHVATHIAKQTSQIPIQTVNLEELANANINIDSILNNEQVKPGAICECILFDASEAVQTEESLQTHIDQTIAQALNAIERELDPLIYTAAGPTDPAVEKFNQYVKTSKRSSGELNQIIGTALGQVLYQIVVKANLNRAVISGGDTSGFATQQLGIYALSALAPTIPGAAIFKAHANGPMDGLQLALKGGQMGSHDYFGWVRDGGGPRT